MAAPRFVATTIALVSVVAAAHPARADRTLAAVTPFELYGGVTIPMGARADDSLLGVIGFPLPIPLVAWHESNENDARRRAPGLRFMLMPELLLGTQHDPNVDETADVTFQFRYGLRFSAPLLGRFDLLTGIGSTLDGWPDLRASLSPELGVRIRIRRCIEGNAEFTSCTFRYMSIMARGELDGSPERPAAVLLLGFVSL